MWLLFFFFSLCMSSPLLIYNNAKFEPNDNHFLLDAISPMTSQIGCVCACFNNSICLTITYLGINHSCWLFSARLEQGILRVISTNIIASVLTFKNKTLSSTYIQYSSSTYIIFFLIILDLPQLTNTNETIYGVWNTTVGGDSTFGVLVIGKEPANAFDNNSNTEYWNYGACNNVSGSSNTLCGENTGLYLSLQRGPSLLVAFQFGAASNKPFNDPLSITIEGSNEPSSVLTRGTSWTLIYNGSSGLDSNPGRGNFGILQSLSTNSIWYASYRMLVTSTRSTSSTYVHYSELVLFGYQQN